MGSTRERVDAGRVTVLSLISAAIGDSSPGSSPSWPPYHTSDGLSNASVNGYVIAFWHPQTKVEIST
jgi:hypothetical protein